MHSVIPVSWIDSKKWLELWENYQYWTENEWERVITYSDEFKFKVTRPNGTQRTRY